MAATLLDRVAGAVPGLASVTGLGGASHRPVVGPQPFEVPCESCGSPVTGTRSAEGRFEPCAACGTAAFVLPADVYPRPPAPAASRKPRKKKTRKTGAAAEFDAAPGPAAPARPAAAGAGGDRGWRRSARRSRRRATPVRLAALGTATVLAATVWWAARGAAAEAARQTLADAPAAVEAALAERRFEAAAAAAAAEADALATLGRGDSPRARRARQLAREATAAAGLASQTPLQIAAEAAAARTPTARAAWADAFDALHRGRWVVVDDLAAAVPPPEPAGGAFDQHGEEHQQQKHHPPAKTPPGPRIELLYPLSAGGVRARLVGDPAVPAGLSVTDPPRRVVFAARYGACVRVADPLGGEPVWELRLEPGTAFLWATPDTLAAAGLDVSEETPAGRDRRAVLTAQAAALGLSEGTSEAEPAVGADA